MKEVPIWQNPSYMSTFLNSQSEDRAQPTNRKKRYVELRMRMGSLRVMTLTEATIRYVKRAVRISWLINIIA